MSEFKDGRPVPAWFEEIPESQRADAEERLRQYLSVAFRIFLRLEAEAKKRRGTLTDVEYGPILEDERSKHQNHETDE